MFLFPSVTDTLGQVVMEAQASGLAALVTDQGGPKTIVSHEHSGSVLPADKPERWIEAAVRLATKPSVCRAMGSAGRALMESRGIKNSFAHFWSEHERVWHEHLRTPAR